MARSMSVVIKDDFGRTYTYLEAAVAVGAKNVQTIRNKVSLWRKAYPDEFTVPLRDLALIHDPTTRAARVIEFANDDPNVPEGSIIPLTWKQLAELAGKSQPFVKERHTEWTHVYNTRHVPLRAFLRGCKLDRQAWIMRLEVTRPAAPDALVNNDWVAARKRWTEEEQEDARARRRRKRRLKWYK